ncbi:hypothetical protein C882_1981 [Caenispirillum salinarum AK4]|uniref:Uncharacterized protein n=1 Tax=Caenispirillum salinarum AK4 TaxID=1238182 RepID=K9GPK6_9PROT|nr:hypothetical protein [Caenispirillum salinarum]EKV27052.1 hypothetical protein C882_1981 [Caenispirillum salinarum AK4]
MGGFASLPPLDTIEDFERLMDSGNLPPGRPSKALLDSLPTPPPPKPMTWVDDGAGEPVPPSWMKTPGRDWYRVVFDDGTEMSAAEYRAWRKKTGTYAPPTAVTADGRVVAAASDGPAERKAPAPAAPDPAPVSPQPDNAAPPQGAEPSPNPASAAPAGPTPQDDRRRRMRAREEAEAARRRTVATSWRGVLTPPPGAPERRRKTLLGE